MATSSGRLVIVVLATIALLHLHTSVVLACYFPIEYQGTFLIQTQTTRKESSTQVTYSEVTIEADAIPPWGRCHKRRGNNIILKDSTGAEDCLRCFHLSMKTPNIIQLHTDGLERCYTNEEAARATCPLDKDIAKKKFKEIILFRKHVPGGLQSVEHVFCPFNGRFRFTYSGNNGKQRCDSTFSEMSNCPHGNALNVKFRKCTFPTTDLSFLCLGDWEGKNGDRYLALMDLREDQVETRPKYRCGIYKEEPNGQISVSLASDSTCSTHLSNASQGFESLKLTPTEMRWQRSDLVRPIGKTWNPAESFKCRFSDWMQGKWQWTKVESNQFTYKDAVNQFRTIRSRCLIRQNDTPNDRFVVHSVTQCGEQSYSCLWIKRRSPNIMEFKYSQRSQVMSEKLCDDHNFASSQWITEGKEKIVAQSTPCPITGDYTGEVPGASGLCAKVASDCNNPDIMFYSVSSCENRSHVYEEREYRCLGNWEEDGILYTFTQRRDMPGHQCFAGKVYRNGDEAYIKEAGEMSCMRGEDEDPIIFGMKITKQASCPRLSPSMSKPPLWSMHNPNVIAKNPSYPVVHKTAIPPLLSPMPPVPSLPAITMMPHPKPTQTNKPTQQIPTRPTIIDPNNWYDPVMPSTSIGFKPIQGHSYGVIASSAQSNTITGAIILLIITCQHWVWKVNWS